MDFGRGPRPKIFFFSEYGHVAYHIKGNETYDNLHANILHTPLSPGLRVKGQNSFFSKSGHFAYQIN